MDLTCSTARKDRIKIPTTLKCIKFILKIDFQYFINIKSGAPWNLYIKLNIDIRILLDSFQEDNSVRNFRTGTSLYKVKN